MASQLYCFVCRKKPQDKKIVQFDEEKFKKCTEILAIRKTRNLAFGDLILPVNLSEHEGYHVECYRKFTALAKKYRESNIHDDVPPSSSTDEQPLEAFPPFE